MPLRAKILNPEFAKQRGYASKDGPIDSLPGDPENDVLFSKHFGLRTIQLNRPDKLNSLNGSMARKIIPRLLEWDKSSMANIVLIKGAGRAFCAGGDVAVLAQDCAKGKAGQQNSKDYFALEYKLDHLIATYEKPYVALIDGITMGGGVGLSVHAPFRIATEKTVFAMPETTIGFFPDVGASFFLPRMDGSLGLYLSLTSERLKGPQVYLAGIATHYIHSSSLPDLEARLAELMFKDTITMSERYDTINKTIEEFTTGLPHDEPLHLDSDIRKAIDHAFHARNETVPEILESLEGIRDVSDQPHVAEWATKTLATIRERSPIGVAVALRQYQEGADWSIEETFQHEYHIASRFMEHPDFVTGVTARLIAKTKGRPNWKPNTLEEVTDEEVDKFFTEDPQALELINEDEDANWTEYPYVFGLPQESEVLSELMESVAVTEQALVDEVEANEEKEEAEELDRKTEEELQKEIDEEMEEGPISALTKDDVVATFNQRYHFKLGTKEKVEEILSRRTTTMPDGRLRLSMKDLPAEHLADEALIESFDEGEDLEDANGNKKKDD